VESDQNIKRDKKSKQPMKQNLEKDKKKKRKRDSLYWSNDHYGREKENG
jgi:hypothetical protein